MGTSHSVIKSRKKLSHAEISGIIFLVLATTILFISPLAAALIAFLYIILCVLGCFFPQTNFLFPVISRGNSGKNYVALTFDDGPSKPTTNNILNLLDKYNVKATFFVSGVNAKRYPEIIREIFARGHSIGNHSYSHSPFLMLKGYSAIKREVTQAKEILKDMGVKTSAFRPPVGIINPGLGKILVELDMVCVTFNRRAGDAGNFFVKSISRKILNNIKPDDIILLHDVPTGNTHNDEIFLSEAEKVIAGISARGLTVVPLSILINREIMGS
ncbi:MAG: polysaccharide deacetylase family protein [Syntrophaceae bacterium]|nr:polysaccharide deacetylase family protein [Syntrophaceae bacterium]